MPGIGQRVRWRAPHGWAYGTVLAHQTHGIVVVGNQLGAAEPVLAINVEPWE